MPETQLVAEPRTEFGKGAARRIRRAHKVPAVLYGHGTAPVHVTLPGHELMLALKGSNALVEIELDGERHLVIAKQVQREPVRRELEHVDFLLVRRGEKVTVEVPVHLIGEAAPGTLVVLEHGTVQVEAEATQIPSRLEIAIDGLAAGAQLHARDVQTPAGVTLLLTPDSLVVHGTLAPTAEQVEAELAEAEAGAGIEHPAAAAEAAPAPTAPADTAAEKPATPRE